MNYKSDYPEDDNDEVDPLQSRHFYELMQDYRHSIWATAEFEAVKAWLRASLVTSESETKVTSESEPKSFKVTNPDRSDHWMQGGSGITNFEKKHLNRYLEAIKKYGDSNLFVGYSMGGYDSAYFALRQKIENGKDLGEFWKIFESLK